MSPLKNSDSMKFSLTIILCQSFEMMVIFYCLNFLIATTIPMKVTINIPKLNIKCNAFAIDITIGLYFQKC